MGYLGRYQQGDVVPLTLCCHDANGTPTVPDNPPFAVFLSDSGLVGSAYLPIEDRYRVTGFFAGSLRLSSSYPVGRYRVRYIYKAGGYYGVDTDYFEVVAGGDPAGAVISLAYFERPSGAWLVQQTETNTLAMGRNPQV